MSEYSYEVTGLHAVAIRIYDEVHAIFDRESSKDKANMYEEWRLEYYIISVMCSPANIWSEVSRANIAKQVGMFYPGYGSDRQPKARYDRAFRRLTQRGFLYGSTHTTNAYYSDAKRERYYGLKLDRYDEEVAA